MMNSDLKKRRSDSNRLKGYDYSHQGAYFVTICTKNRIFLFGNIESGKMLLSPTGKIVHQAWLDIANYFEDIGIDSFVIMPNHVHGIINFFRHGESRRSGLINQTTTSNQPSSSWIMMQNDNITLGKIVRYFKAKATRIIRKNVNPEFQWQRNYYDRIVRNEKELNNIREYILGNPFGWELDRENPISDNYNVDIEVYYRDVFRTSDCMP